MTTLSEIKARSAHDNDENVYATWRTEDALRAGAQAMIDRAWLLAEVARLREWSAGMVVKMAEREPTLDGYREMGMKLAAIEADRDWLRSVLASAPEPLNDGDSVPYDRMYAEWWQRTRAYQSTSSK